MSGEAGGLIVIPLALGAMPVLLAGLAVAGLVQAGVTLGKAAVNYKREQRSRREGIRESRVSGQIGDFREDWQQTMRRHTEQNRRTSDQMLLELERQRNEMRQAAEQQDVQAFARYVSQMKESRTRAIGRIVEWQEHTNADYQKSITENVARSAQIVNTQYAQYLSELAAMQEDAAAQSQRAKETASAYLEEARTLLAALETDFDGAKFSSRPLAALRGELSKAEQFYQSGRYEAAIAGAKDTVIGTLEEIGVADMKQQEWDNYYKLALSLSEEVKTYLEAQEFITEGAKAYAEKVTGQPLESQVVGIRIADYTDRNSLGQTRYDYFLQRARGIYNDLRQPNAKDFTVSELRRTVEFLNNELYPSAAMCIHKAVVNMNNAFSRQSIGEEIIDFFEEHDFTFGGYVYDEQRHDKALHIDLQNEASGEELIVTLSPELLEGGDIQTRVELKQIKGDELNETRKAYYRECVTDAVKNGNPAAQVELHCKSETRNRLSDDTEIKRKLQGVSY